MAQERSDRRFAMKTRVTDGDARAVQPNAGVGTRLLGWELVGLAAEETAWIESQDSLLVVDAYRFHPLVLLQLRWFDVLLLNSLATSSRVSQFRLRSSSKFLRHLPSTKQNLRGRASGSFGQLRELKLS